MSRAPTFDQERFRRPVEPEIGEPGFSGNRLDPVASMPSGAFGPHKDRQSRRRSSSGSCATRGRRSLLRIVDQAARIGVVDRDGPEIRNRRVGRARASLYVRRRRASRRLCPCRFQDIADADRDVLATIAGAGGRRLVEPGRALVELVSMRRRVWLGSRTSEIMPLRPSGHKGRQQVLLER